MYPPFFGGCPGEGKYSKPSIFRQRLAILRKDVYRKQVVAFSSRFAIKHVLDAIEENGEGVALRMLTTGEFEAAEKDLM